MSDNAAPSGHLNTISTGDVHAALAEAHARPPLPMAARGTVQHIAFQCSDDQSRALLHEMGQAEGDALPRYAIAQVGTCTLKYERHTEFSTLTALCPDAQAGEAVPQIEMLRDSADAVILTNLEVLFFESIVALLKQAEHKRHLGGTIIGNVEVRSTLQADDDGRVRFLVKSTDADDHELGRRIQRLIEAETYRVLTLIGLEKCRQANRALSALETQIDALLSEAGTGGDGPDETMLHRLADLSGALNTLRAATRFRIAASRAYYDLSTQRMVSLEERKSADLQTLTGFMRSRLDPAISTIRALDQRQTNLSSEITNALSLLRTRVDVKLSLSNEDSLRSLQRQNRQQLLISQTVEGLSVVAISYYAVGLVSYLLKGAESVGLLPVTYTIATAIAVPLVVLFVALSVRKLRGHWELGEAS